MLQRLQTDIMVDNETLGLKMTSGIIEIGACAFNRDDPPTLENVSQETFETLISPTSLMEEGFTIDFSTLTWWMSQNDQIRGIFKRLELAPPVRTALDHFYSWCKSFPNLKRVWSNGLSFDIPMIEYAYDHLDMPRPWKYDMGRDTRTLKDDFPAPKVVIGEKHAALADAQTQALWVLAMREKMKKAMCQCP